MKFWLSFCRFSVGDRFYLCGSEIYCETHFKGNESTLQDTVQHGIDNNNNDSDSSKRNNMNLIDYSANSVLASSCQPEFTSQVHWEDDS